jgi:dienelactone hydrolase
MIRTETIIYEGPDGLYEGYVSWDETLGMQTRPGVLISHAYFGVSQFEIDKSIALAHMGYVGVAIDMYGKGKRAKTAEEANALMSEVNNNRPLLSDRINRALDVMKASDIVDPQRVGAIGFCFGGKCVLDLARSGADVKGVVSFHGILDTPPSIEAKKIKASILVCHGWNDPLATPAQVTEFAKEMNNRKADWQLHAYGHTGHSFKSCCTKT